VGWGIESFLFYYTVLKSPPETIHTHGHTHLHFHTGTPKQKSTIPTWLWHVFGSQILCVCVCVCMCVCVCNNTTISARRQSQTRCYKHVKACRAALIHTCINTPTHTQFYELRLLLLFIPGSSCPVLVLSNVNVGLTKQDIFKKTSPLDSWEHLAGRSSPACVTPALIAAHERHTLIYASGKSSLYSI